MKLQNVLLLSQTAGYIMAFILAVCIIIPMSMYTHDFEGHCLLFSTGDWRETDGQLIVNWASQAYCNFTIFVGCLLSVVSIAQVYRMSRYLKTNTDCTFLLSFIDVVCCVSLSFMTLAAAAMVTLGFSHWCDIMTLRFPSCEVAAGIDFDKQDKIDSSNFYMEMGGAQFGAWASWACWVGLSVFATVKLASQHQLRNVRVSMLRERQRLIKGAGTGSGADVRGGPGPSSSNESLASTRTKTADLEAAAEAPRAAEASR